MMGGNGGYGMMGTQGVGAGMGYGVGTLGLIVWALIVVLLVVMIRYFWNRGGKK